MRRGRVPSGDFLEEAEVVAFEKEDTGPEFVSQIEQVRKAKELLFEPAPGFGKYRIYFPKSDGKNPDAVAHPAKMHVGFCEYLITRYTKPGETILDPMSGAGTTAAVGAPLGRNVVTVELEGKFVDWQKGLKQKIEEAPMLMKGEITVIKGDARRLSQLLGVVDAEVVSPPYSASLRRKNRNVKDLDRLRKAGYSDKWIEQHHDQPNQNIAISGQGYSKDPGNIGNLAHGKIDGVVMSPPYSLGIGHGTGASTEKIAQEKELGVRGHGSYSGTIDGIVTSPPYNTRTDGEGLNKTAIPNVRGVMQGRTETMKYSNDRVGNIGEIKTHGNIDAVITSPAYSDSLGKLTKETYLQAMKKVYENMFIVLKPGGLAVIVVKAFNRNKRVVDLPWQTWLLLHAVGFGFEDVVKMRIRNLSFWRIMLYKKYPSIDRIRHEYAIVVRKPASSNMEV
jgi:DNA modification methylase